MNLFILLTVVSENVTMALGMVGKGMLGIFVVIGIIAVIVAILIRLSGGKKDN